MQETRRQIFRAIAGRPHSGRTMHAIRMALLIANTQPNGDEPNSPEENTKDTNRKVLVICPDMPFMTSIQEMWAERGEKIELMTPDQYMGYYWSHHIGDQQYIAALIADEVEITPEAQRTLFRILETLKEHGNDTVVALPSLVGYKDDLKMTSEARAILNRCPVGTDIYLTEVKPINTDKFEERCQVRHVGKTMPFKI